MTSAPSRVIGGRYRLLRRLGQGGMGTVWEGHDGVLDRRVAVKEVTLPPGTGDAHRAEMIERATREARTAARISHRNIIAIHDVVQEDGRPWIVMELVPSRSLDQIVEEDGPLTAVRAAAIGRQVLDALTCAHAVGVVHRDVKPANILIGHDGRIVLSDFGIATAEGDPSLTRTGMVTGSPSFIAPERVSGAQADPASDLWSLGASLYAMVTGRSPFHRDSGGMAVLAALISREEADLSPVPPALRPAVGGLLVKDPARRIGAAEADRLLAMAEASDPGQAVRPSRPEPTRPGAAGVDYRSPAVPFPQHPPLSRHTPTPQHRPAFSMDQATPPPTSAPRSRAAHTRTLGPGGMALLIGAALVLLLGAIGGTWALMQEEEIPKGRKQPTASATKPAPQRKVLTLLQFPMTGGWSLRAPKAWLSESGDDEYRWWNQKKSAVLTVQVASRSDPHEVGDVGEPQGILAKLEAIQQAEPGNGYRRVRFDRTRVPKGQAAELEYTAVATESDPENPSVKGKYRRVVRVVTLESAICILDWQVQEKSWNAYEPTMRAVFDSLVSPA
ncbi:serine/threonine-protein kinase [Sphaerimonospora thailandensis]|uniref:non-specific serine/threonine protein kinase n=1 Tax=Sphaerimonospora thailandensis TaxID=795644 RepID=A0A8J3W0F2_9ACTN|nr:serine/threonine-protein kinase [Sphaerimonospora thailandensis]GIH71028.1 hypothetical protein Mth01_32810 [Sphaerimonospora thailandensis]